MEFSVMDREEMGPPGFDKPVDKPQADVTHALSSHAKADGRATVNRFDRGVQITDSARWHPAGNRARLEHQTQNSCAGPTWNHLLGQIIVGAIEILIPLAFIGGMIYWRVPWLFWAMVHFLKGEPILTF
jgi:hypothetical protein